MFTVIRTFVDPWDGCRLYKAGGSWPRPGYDPPPDAIPALLGAGLEAVFPASSSVIDMADFLRRRWVLTGA